MKEKEIMRQLRSDLAFFKSAKYPELERKAVKARKCFNAKESIENAEKIISMIDELISKFNNHRTVMKSENKEYIKSQISYLENLKKEVQRSFIDQL
jgi:hypothetical protein